MTHDDYIDSYIGMVFDELRRAEHKFPGFPTDPIHAAAVLAERVNTMYILFSMTGTNRFSYGVA